MTEINVDGVLINFPFEPYELQINYMKKVIKCLQNGENGILESPTGTGKTLCLLCSTLGWLQIKKAQHRAQMLASKDAENNSDLLTRINAQLEVMTGDNWEGRAAPPKIIYSSRTHSQLSQAMAELKRTTYRHFKVSVIGSRDQLCIHPEVSKETNNRTKTQMCQNRVKQRNCYFYNQIDSKKLDIELKNEILDIEELVNMGKKKSFCPYFMTRETKTEADIIFMPYNYLIDPYLRKIHGIDLRGNVIIFDEAHNVEKVCEESASLQITSADIAMAIDEVTHIMKKIQDISEMKLGDNTGADGELPEDFTLPDLCILKAVFLEFEKAVDEIELPSAGGGISFDGGYIFELLEKADISFDKKNIILDTLDKLILYLSTNAATPFQRKGAGLMKFQDLVKIVYSRDTFSSAHLQFIKRSYKVHVDIVTAKPNDSKKQGGWSAPINKNKKENKVLSYWCFHPGFGMKDVVDQGCRCILLTSGTLSPIDTFCSELGLSFPNQLENPHIIEDKQVFVAVVSKGPDGHELNSSFRTRNDPRYLQSLALTIINFSRPVDGGILIFFPSYPILAKCRDHWQENGMWAKLSAIMPIYIEPRGKDGFQSTMNDYYKALKDPVNKKVCFMAVCRGKVSEGLDFANRNGRSVMIVGLPYPPFMDPRVKLKQKYLDDNRNVEKKGLTGSAWYLLEASRAVNQAIGRVIRHKDDFGAILLCDKRFGDRSFNQNLSSWVKNQVNIFNSVGPALKGLHCFYKNQNPPIEDLSRITKEEPASDNTSHISSSYLDNKENVRKVPRAQPISNGELSHTNTEIDHRASYSGEIKSKKPTEKLSLFASESRSAIVDFNASSSKNFSASYEVISNAKKKKIKLMNPLDKNLENFINSATPDNSQSKPEDSNGNVSSQQSNNNKSNDGKSRKISDYIQQVKSELNPENYQIFSKSVKQYHKNKNIEQIIEVLSTLFQESKYRPLLYRFSQFVFKEDRLKFEQHLKDMKK